MIKYSEKWDDAIISDGYLREQIEQLNIEVHPDTQKQIDVLTLPEKNKKVKKGTIAHN